MNNILFFTPNQFVYLLEKRARKRIQGGSTVVGMFFLLCALLSLPESNFIELAVIMCFFVSSFALFISGDPKASQEERKLCIGLSMFFNIFMIFDATMMVFRRSSTVAFWAFDISVILGIILIYLGFRKLPKLKYIPQSFSISSTQLQKWINAWTEANGSIEKMLPSPATEIQSISLNSDVTAYSFDRAIVCDSAEIAQFLIANNFHFENSCAVLSIDGYPQNIFSTVMEMLRRNPDLKVYAVRDASPQGVSLVNQLQTNANWFANSSATVYDLGLSPRQVLRSRSLFIRNSSDSKEQAARLSQSVKQELSPDELEWLEKGNFVELESLMPRRLLRVLTRGIALSQAPDVEDALIPVESDSGLVFATDSFG